ncbi:MAG TPA: ankyrin repeat domain-containing protein [Candidatus Limnocylindrales bacterium]|nr:ankyrin repeat domain-containing protein [Candidatus Limnocylindrales bacterium]
MPSDVELIAAVKDGLATRVAEMVAAEPALSNARDVDGVSAIMLSRYRSDRPVTDALLQGDPDLDIYEAAALGYVDRLGARLDDDASAVHAKSPDGFTALHFAAFFGKAEVARILLEAGARVDDYAENVIRVQPLHSAAANRHLEMCRLLLAAGADVNAREGAGYTPLHAAAQHGDPEMVELFLSAQADPSAATDSGETPAATAEAAGHVDVARRLREVAAAR